MSVPARLTHADWEVNYGKANIKVINDLKHQFDKVVKYVDDNNIPDYLRNLGAKVTEAQSLKSTVRVVLVGNRRAGKSLLGGHLMFDQDDDLKNPLRVDDGLQHVTTTVTLAKHAQTFSVTLQPLPETTRNAIIKHADTFNENLVDEQSERIILPEHPDVVSKDSLDLAAAAFKRSTPHEYHELMDFDNLASAFEAQGTDPACWPKSDQYRFINACCELVANSPDFAPYAQFFVLEICAPWLPEDVELWDTPGLGDGRFTPLVKHALTQAEVIVPYQRGSAVNSTTISKCFEFLAEVNLKELQTHPPMLLLFEKPGQTELGAYRDSWAGDPPSDEFLAQRYCSDVRRTHYRNEVLTAADSECAGKIGGLDLFAELRNTLMVQADTCRQREEGMGPTRAVLHDRGLHQELLHRTNYRAVNVWVHTCACFFFQARSYARAQSKPQKDRFTRKRFGISDQALDKSADSVCDAVETVMKESWEELIETSSEEDDSPVPLFFNRWLVESRDQVLALLRSEWTQLTGAALLSHREVATNSLLEEGVPRLVADELFEGLFAQISAQDFAEDPRRVQDTTTASATCELFTRLARRAGQLAQNADQDTPLSALLFAELCPGLRGIVQGWAKALKPIVRVINAAFSNCYATLEQPRALNSEASKALLDLCLEGSTLVNKVISKPDAKPPTKTLKLPLPKFFAQPRSIPDIVRQPTRLVNRGLEASFDLDRPFTAHLGLPYRQEGLIKVPMQAHPNVKAIVTSFKQRSHELDAVLALPPVIVLGCQGGELVDSINSTGFGLELEERFHQRKLKPVTALRILLVDEPTAAQAGAFSGNLSQSLLMFVVKTGGRYLSPGQLLDYCHLLGAWLAEDEKIGDAIVPGPQLFVRMESSAKTFKEASTGIQIVPCSPGRMFKGLEKALLEEIAYLEQLKASEIVNKWDVSSMAELRTLYPALEEADRTSIMIASNKIKGDNPAQQLIDLQTAIFNPEFPEAVRAEVLEALRVEVLSASTLTEGPTRKRWLAQKAATLEKNREQNLRCNYRVRFHKSSCSTYEQTQCVLVNSKVVRGLWACKESEFLASPSDALEASFVKSLRKAEGKIAYALKVIVKEAGDGTTTKNKKGKTISSGLCCLVVDQFCVNSHFRTPKKGTGASASPTARATPGKRPVSARKGSGSAKKAKPQRK